MSRELNALLRPDTIAVLGASRDPHKWGQRVIRYTRAAGFTGEIFAVNPRASAEDIPAATVVADLAESGTPISCAFLAVPRDAVLGEVERCCSLGVSTIVVAASGFGESSAAGAELERRVLELAHAAGVRVVGPNCFGVFSAVAGVNLTPFEYVPPGRVALVSQSGNVSAELFIAAGRAGIGFSYCIGVGNQADVGFGDLLAEFAKDPHTDAVAMYVEGLPTGGGARFVAGLEACQAAGKPVVVIKAGASTLAAAVAQTHTRSLAADDRVWDSALARGGAIRVDSAAEMIDVLRCAVRLPVVGPRLAVVTDGGGDSVLALDSLARTRLRPARLHEQTIRTLEPIIPPAAPRVDGLNPLTLDTAGGVEDDPMVLARCVAAVAADEAVDVVLVGGLFGTYVDARAEEIRAARALVEVAAEGRVSLVLAAPVPPAESEPLALLAEAGVPFFESLDRAVRTLDRLLPHDLADAAEPTAATDHADAPPPQARPAPTAPAGPRAWPVGQAVEMLTRSGVRLPRMELVTDRAALLAAVEEIGYPVCLKTADPRVVHKSDVGGVFVGLAGPEDVERAAKALWRQDPTISLLVMPSFPRAFEMLVGGFHDPCFGPVVMIGRGGVLTEVEADTCLVTGEITAASVRAAMERLRCFPVLRGYRGSPPLALDALGDIAVALGVALASDPTLSIDLNPVLVYPDRCAVADVRVLSTTGGEQATDPPESGV